MKKRVLVVEDDPVLTRVLSDNLTFEGFEVRTVSDGNDALSVGFDIGTPFVVRSPMSGNA